MSASRTLAQLSARIFGSIIGNGLPSGRKVLRQKPVGEKIASWYPTPLQKQDPAYVDPEEKARVLKLERMKRRGKGAPKKGQGKRSAKRNK